MSTPVRGPGDVKPGDLVRVHEEHRIATVVSATASRMKVAVDGREIVKAYVRKETDRYKWRGRSVSMKPNFHRLTAWDRWERNRPSTPDLGRHGYGDGGSLAIEPIKVRTRPDDICKQIIALSAWLRDEPSKEAP